MTESYAVLRRSFFLICVMASAHSVADRDSGETAETDEMSSAMLREILAEPLYTELLQGGLSPLRAERASDRLMNGLTQCWESELNETDWEEPAVTRVRMGGQTIATYDTPCLEAFLAAVSEAKP